MRDRHEQLLLLPSDAARRKARENIQQSSRNGPLPAAQNRRSPADGNIQFAVRSEILGSKTIESIGGRSTSHIRPSLPHHTAEATLWVTTRLVT
jgi:hypothetical protein